MAAFLMHSRRGFSLIYPYAGQWWSVSVAMALMVFSVATDQHELLTSASMVLVVMTSMLRPEHCLRFMLDNRIARYIGTVSYGMYLMHMFAYHATKRLLGINAGFWSSFLLTSVLTVGIATVSYYVFERRFLALKKHFQQPTASGLTEILPAGTRPTES
jgi:peptidoglycan/LPS O-acetylase OafA/YrhL